MPNATTKKRADRDLAQGKSASTAAGEFVREEIHHIREGKHGARNTKQAIAIGLSQARRAGVPLEASPSASESTRRKAEQETRLAGKMPNPRRARASEQARRKEPHSAASHAALSKQARASAEKRRKAGGANAPRAAAQRAARTRKREASATS
jgi:hypothetical protein